MGQKILVFLLLVFRPILGMAVADNQDFPGLMTLKEDWKKKPPGWKGSDPCSDWEGIECTGSRVTSIKLSSMGLEGTLSEEIQNLSELQTLDLSYNKGLIGKLPQSIGKLKKLTNLILVGCSFSGPIPDTIGSLEQLFFLSLNSNKFSGGIPPSIGNLPKLNWLDMADNNLEGPIPVSNGSTSGLDMLLHTKHFHFGKNKLSGEILEKLFNSSMKLIHVLFESNNLTGKIPSTLGLVQTLEVVRFDRNNLVGKVPSNLNSLTNVSELYLSNNRLSGPVPDITGMNNLAYLDMSNNSFDVSDIPTWFSTLTSLTTLIMERTKLKGELPVDLFSLPSLQTVVLKNNQVNGTLDIGTIYSNRLQLIDLQYNSITEYKKGLYSDTLILANNPVCQETETETGTGTESYCKVSTDSQSDGNSTYTTPSNNCVPSTCNPNQISSPNCRCAYPYTGILEFRAPSFSDLGNKSIYKELENKLLTSFQSHQLLVDSVALSDPKKGSIYLDLSLEVFPYSRDRFNRTEISEIGFLLSNQTFKPPKYFGPFVFHGDEYENYGETEKSKSSIGIIIGAAAGGSVLVLLLLLVGVYAFRQKRRAERSSEISRPFVLWDANKTSAGAPQLKGARWFSYEELAKYTNNFSTANEIGSGGFGKVYRGNLPTGELIAIKKSEKESKQGGREFKTEIELLSRVHHKNLVSLVGFCFENNEQLLIYEYVPNGSLKDSLSGKSGIRLDWMRRLKASLGTARGLAYLHELANPPIIHRDIKSTNVLLDDHLNAKVADFGLSKLIGEDDEDHISTQVKGTMGYLDPEYYMSQQLTEKSDVYSFGVLMLELITARTPIEKGKYIVREVQKTLDKNQGLYNLHRLLDPSIGLATKLRGFEKYVDLALRCVEEAGSDRPTMSEVVKEIENIMELAGLNPNADSASASASYEEVSKPSSHYSPNNETFYCSGAFPPSQIEPQ
ncbi:leucine-rich repeat receptor protein kinase HPCA1 [Ziziphus jujuba]|uniref:Leucine-rich repeat receptor protein kinase HPCA1 n=1 Tax=Ziziphus jujuba TaxID=326968 RepID=A0A6P4A970_ZIZJJ|nr:leucine-rich repeat receptor protein kinase HPCA1 [Ziziphus jujuba]